MAARVSELAFASHSSPFLCCCSGTNRASSCPTCFPALHVRIAAAVELGRVQWAKLCAPTGPGGQPLRRCQFVRAHVCNRSRVCTLFIHSRSVPDALWSDERCDCATLPALPHLPCLLCLDVHVLAGGFVVGRCSLGPAAAVTIVSNCGFLGVGGGTGMARSPTEGAAMFMWQALGLDVCRPPAASPTD